MRAADGTILEIIRIRKDVIALFISFPLVAGLIATNLPLFISTGIALAGMIWLQRPKNNSSAHTLTLTLNTLLFSFWMFLFFVRLGWATWPMQRASSINEWLTLLYMQCVLAIILAPACMFYYLQNSSRHYLRWGAVTVRRSPLSIFVWMGTAVAWLCSMIYVVKNTHEVSVSLAGLVAVLTLKAGLYTLTEEVCFRGVIMPAIGRRIGIQFSIIYQAALFTAFHFFLNPPFFSQPIFLSCVAGLGLLFGWITYKTRGIGWAWMCHWAIGVTVEWSNRL